VAELDGAVGRLDGRRDEPELSVALDHHRERVGEDLVVVADQQGDRPVRAQRSS
jgi:hypothetical protein